MNRDAKNTTMAPRKVLVRCMRCGVEQTYATTIGTDLTVAWLLECCKCRCGGTTEILEVEPPGLASVKCPRCGFSDYPQEGRYGPICRACGFALGRDVAAEPSQADRSAGRTVRTGPKKPCYDARLGRDVAQPGSVPEWGSDSPEPPTEPESSDDPDPLATLFKFKDRAERNARLVRLLCMTKARTRAHAPLQWKRTRLAARLAAHWGEAFAILRDEISLDLELLSSERAFSSPESPRAPLMTGARSFSDPRVVIETMLAGLDAIYSRPGDKWERIDAAIASGREFLAQSPAVEAATQPATPGPADGSDRQRASALLERMAGVLMAEAALPDQLFSTRLALKAGAAALTSQADFLKR